MAGCILAVLAAAGAAPAAENARAALEAAAARQLAAVAAQDGSAGALARSVARQRAAVERQARTAAPWPAPASYLPADPPPSCGRLPEAEAEAIVQQAASREGLAPALVRAVIERESAFRPCAVSPKGALGLMQLMPATAADLGVKDIFDPVENAASGARFLARLVARYGGDLELALGAYNAGPARVDAGGGVPDIPETRDYVRAILGSLGVR